MKVTEKKGGEGRKLNEAVENESEIGQTFATAAFLKPVLSATASQSISALFFMCLTILKKKTPSVAVGPFFPASSAIVTDLVMGWICEVQGQSDPNTKQRG